MRGRGMPVQVEGELVVDDAGQPLEVQPTASHVRRHHDGVRVRAELRQGLLAFVLGLLPMDELCSGSGSNDANDNNDDNDDDNSNTTSTTNNTEVWRFLFTTNDVENGTKGAGGSGSLPFLTPPHPRPQIHPFPPVKTQPTGA